MTKATAGQRLRSGIAELQEIWETCTEAQRNHLRRKMKAAGHGGIIPLLEAADTRGIRAYAFRCADAASAASLAL